MEGIFFFFLLCQDLCIAPPAKSQMRNIFACWSVWKSHISVCLGRVKNVHVYPVSFSYCMSMSHKATALSEVAFCSDLSRFLHSSAFCRIECSVAVLSLKCNFVLMAKSLVDTEVSCEVSHSCFMAQRDFCTENR